MQDGGETLDAGRPTYKSLMAIPSLLPSSALSQSKSPLGSVQIKGHALNGQVGEHIRCQPTIANPILRTLSSVSYDAQSYEKTEGEKNLQLHNRRLRVWVAEVVELHFQL